VGTARNGTVPARRAELVVRLGGCHPSKRPTPARYRAISLDRYLVAYPDADFVRRSTRVSAGMCELHEEYHAW